MQLFNVRLFTVLAFVLTPMGGLSRTIHVPADYPTIQAAINSASAVTNDTVLVSPGVYNEAVSFNGKPVLLISASGPGATMILPPSGTSAISFTNAES